MKKRLFVIVLSLVMIITMMPLGVFANSSGDEEVVTSIGDSGICLVSDRHAVDGTDYSYEEFLGRIDIYTNGWKITGTGTSKYIHINILLKEETFVRLSDLNVEEFACTGKKNNIQVNGNVCVDSFRCNGENIISGNGSLISKNEGIENNGRKSDLQSLTLDLPYVKANTSNKNSNCAGIKTHKLNIKRGTVIATSSEDILEPEELDAGICSLDNDINIADRAEVFASGSDGAIVGVDPDTLDVSKYKGNTQIIDYAQKDQVSDNVEIESRQGQPTFCVNGDLAQTVYHAIVKHKVNFIVDGTEYISKDVIDGESVNAPENPTKAGYIFDGWFEEGALQPFDFNTPITSDLTLIAHWSEEEVPQVEGFGAKATDSKTCSLSWSEVAISGVEYQVYRKTGESSEFSKIATTNKTSYIDSKVIPGTKYYYKVRANLDGKTGEFSSVDYGYPRLFQVIGISAKALNAAKSQITWNANGNKNVVYQVYRSVKSDTGFNKVGTITDGKTSFSQSFTPEQSGKKYYYKVRAITKDYTGKWHYGTFSKVDYAYPRVATPTNFKAWASDKHTCNCTWNKVAGSSIKYLVYRGTRPTGNWGNAIATTSKTSLTNKKMKSGQKYYYMVRAFQTINGKNYFSNYSTKDYAYPR